METFGDRLRSERERRNLSLEAVAASLGVERAPLEALERNDFAALPDEETMTACLRAYAARLEVDAELMIEDYRRERERTLDRLDAAVMRIHASRRRLAVAAISTAALAFLALWVFTGREAQQAPAPSPPPSATETREPATSPPVRVVPPTPAPAPIVEPPPDSMWVTDHGVGNGVRRRELVGRGDRFLEGTQVSFWTRVEGANAGDGIEHVWLHEGVEAARMPLTIGGAAWRTHSTKRLHAGSAGRWAVEARDGAGRVLARSEFVCAP